MRKIYKTTNNHKPKTTIRRLTPLQASYIAGMIDGDGSICLCKNRSNIIAKVRIHNSSKKLMLWLKRTIKCGNISSLPPSIEGKGYKHTLIRWTYDISAKVDVLSILNQIKPYLIIKKEKAIQVINFINDGINDVTI